MWHHRCKKQEYEEEDQRGRQRERFPAADRLSEVGSGGVARSRHRTPKTIFHPRHLLPSASVSPSCRLISGCVDSVICSACVYTCCGHRQQRLLSPRPSIRCWSLHRCVSSVCRLLTSWRARSGRLRVASESPSRLRVASESLSPSLRIHLLNQDECSVVVAASADPLLLIYETIWTYQRKYFSTKRPVGWKDNRIWYWLLGFVFFFEIVKKHCLSETLIIWDVQNAFIRKEQRWAASALCVQL